MRMSSDSRIRANNVVLKWTVLSVATGMFMRISFWNIVQQRVIIFITYVLHPRYFFNAVNRDIFFQCCKQHYWLLSSSHDHKIIRIIRIAASASDIRWHKWPRFQETGASGHIFPDQVYNNETALCIKWPILRYLLQKSSCSTQHLLYPTGWSNKTGLCQLSLKSY